MLVYSDGLAEVGEGFCGYITAEAGSAAAISAEDGKLFFSFLIADKGKYGGGQISCVKGARCTIDLSKSMATAFIDQAGNWSFLQDVEHGVDCLPCSIGMNQSYFETLGTPL